MYDYKEMNMAMKGSRGIEKEIVKRKDEGVKTMHCECKNAPLF